MVAIILFGKVLIFSIIKSMRTDDQGHKRLFRHIWPAKLLRFFLLLVFTWNRTSTMTIIGKYDDIKKSLCYTTSCRKVRDQSLVFSYNIHVKLIMFCTEIFNWKNWFEYFFTGFSREIKTFLVKTSV